MYNQESQAKGNLVPTLIKNEKSTLKSRRVNGILLRQTRPNPDAYILELSWGKIK